MPFGKGGIDISIMCLIAFPKIDSTPNGLCLSLVPQIREEMGSSLVLGTAARRKVSPPHQVVMLLEGEMTTVCSPCC